MLVNLILRTIDAVKVVLIVPKRVQNSQNPPSKTQIHNRIKRITFIFIESVSVSNLVHFIY